MATAPSPAAAHFPHNPISTAQCFQLPGPSLQSPAVPSPRNPPKGPTAPEFPLPAGLTPVPSFSPPFLPGCCQALCGWDQSYCPYCRTHPSTGQGSCKEGEEGRQGAWAATESFVSAEGLNVRNPRREEGAPWGYCREL